MTEKQFEKQVRSWLDATFPDSWVLKTHGGGMQRSGIPDLICCINGKFVGLELKTDIGVLSKLQIVNINWIIGAGGYCREVKPSNFEEVKSELLQLF